ncbi:LAMI_0F15236g1_1 [Lachancea mirantina]|uniref:LAMI_0F15236g1_1 n=1 Tax=Lachancea mirantina TaxID=1230905 RepID=A0A1G4K458_9SACH|nr:LAMI_0F15236g1_1 [Lachancea mirantina]
MKSQKIPQRTNRTLIANSNVVNIESSSHSASARLGLERSPKKQNSFKIQKNRRYEPQDLLSPHIESADRSSGFFMSPVAVDSMRPEDSFPNSGAHVSPRNTCSMENPPMRYAFMNYSQSNSNIPLNTSLYANPNISAVVSRELTGQDVSNVFDEFENFGFQTFPPYFNPRTAVNMPHQEKVTKWIEHVPVHSLSDGVWESECYSVDDTIDWEECEFDYGLENRHKFLSFSLSTPDELLQLQAKKIDSMVRRLYELTPEFTQTSSGQISMSSPSL